MKCFICETEITTGVVCDTCREGYDKYAKRLKDQQSIAKKAGEVAEKTVFAITKAACKGIQFLQPAVRSAAEGAKKAWNEAKEKK